MQLILGRDWYTRFTPELLEITGRRAFGSRSSSHGTASQMRQRKAAPAQIGWRRIDPKESWIPSVDSSTLHLCMVLKCNLESECLHETALPEMQKPGRTQTTGSRHVGDLRSAVRLFTSSFRTGDCCQLQLYVCNWECISPIPAVCQVDSNALQTERRACSFRSVDCPRH